MMNTTQDLLQFLLRHDHVAVFGNLGRNPEVVFDMVASDPQLNVVIYSPHYLTPATPDERIQVITSMAPVRTCDLFIILEPESYTLVQKPHNAARCVVFTSHFTFTSLPETVWIHASYFHTMNVMEMAHCTQELLKIQDPSIQAHSVNNVKVNAIHQQVITGRMDNAMTTANTFVIVDLTQHTHPFIMSLAFWDAFDYMLANKDFIQGWLICFPLNQGRKAFEQFTQNCLDALFCKTFEHGNVTDLSKVLTLVPYYKSGSIDQTFDIPKYRFVGVEYIVTANPSDACKAASMHNVKHWVDNIYRVVE